MANSFLKSSSSSNDDFKAFTVLRSFRSNFTSSRFNCLFSIDLTISERYPLFSLNEFQNQYAAKNNTNRLNKYIFVSGISLKLTRKKMVNPATPSTIDFMVPSINGLYLFFLMVVSGSHKISLIALYIENLNTWSENFNTKIAIIEPNMRKPIDPNTRVIGKNIRPARIPNLVRIRPVIRACIKSVAAPVNM